MFGACAACCRRSMAPSAGGSKGAIAFYAVYGACFFVSLLRVGIVGVGVMPVFFSVTTPHTAGGLDLGHCLAALVVVLRAAELHVLHVQLFPLQLDNLEWAQTWLLQTIFD
eukprot:COSAG01_NODE_2515_length_7529_cov_77.394347_7_plen_111_part_00